MDINAKNKYNSTALMNASDKGHLEIVKHLLENEADINIINKDGDNALMCASFGRNNVEVVKYLIKNNAKVNIENKEGKTALDLAANEEIRKLLIEAREIENQK